MLGRYVQLLCGLAKLPLFDATDALGRCERYCVGPTMQFTHRPLIWHGQCAADLNYDNVIKPFQDKRVVLLFRCPLDALVSLWMQRRHRSGENYSGNLPEFLEAPVWGLEKYFEFYSQWFQHRDHVRDLYLLRYEDTRKDPSAVFGRLLDFLAIPRNDDAFQQAVADSDFERMKKVELSGDAPKYESSGRSIFASGDLSNVDALHVRRGKVGGYHDYLEQKDAVRFEAIVAHRLPDFFWH